MGARSRFSGDSITTDHLASRQHQEGQPGRQALLIEHGVQPGRDFNSYGARRGNHEVMRGTFANTRLKNQLAPGTEGGWTTYQSRGGVMAIYDAAMSWQGRGRSARHPGWQGYGSGSSRDWAAKVAALLGVKAVIAESFERIHRSNLVNMGVLPLLFTGGANAASLGISGTEVFEISGADGLRPQGTVKVKAVGADKTIEFEALVRIDTPEELVAFKHGGIPPYVLRQLVAKK